ncbi:class I SAM-dependent methyltransferase [Winogradskyella maritima]|uniref:Class I SAM-dependent methyltransferase n=1 Tax=Winogradskyella maritima TaxID=1517766 RepID=A0ABV8AFX0_9FLAO|nr:class I SAM-dependent methyltransferase [Winogradskyella maritima]
MSQHENYFEVNKATWNKKVAIHAQSEMYDMKSFKAGKTSLMPYELKALGDVNGKSLLHLQCHFGQDTISWSRLGATCTGIDISDSAIDLARSLAKELKADAQFVCCNVLDTSKHVKEQFDIVFTSYGTIGWLPDLKPWAQMIAERLKPGGVFYIAEFHPILWMFDYTDGQAVMQYHYNQEAVIYDEYKGTYADQNSDIISKEYGWNHGLADVVNALIEAGLTIDYLNEHDESPYDVFPNLKKNESGMYVMEEQLFPMIFEVKAIKKT